MKWQWIINDNKLHRPFMKAKYLNTLFVLFIIQAWSTSQSGILKNSWQNFSFWISLILDYLFTQNWFHIEAKIYYSCIFCTILRTKEFWSVLCIFCICRVRGIMDSLCNILLITITMYNIPIFHLIVFNMHYNNTTIIDNW